MYNTNVECDGNTLIIKIDLEDEGKKSGSGKSMVIASTKGNKRLEALTDDFPEGCGDVFIGLNVYKKIK